MVIKARRKTKKSGEKVYNLSEKDRKILNLLTTNSRRTLKSIGKEVGLSIDTTKSRIGKMKDFGVIKRFTILIDGRSVGLPLDAHIYIKLKDFDEQNFEKFKNYCLSNSRIIVFMTMLGDYDVHIVLASKDAIEMSQLKRDKRKKFSFMINDWKEVIVSQVFKLEEHRF